MPISCLFLDSELRIGGLGVAYAGLHPDVDDVDAYLLPMSCVSNVILVAHLWTRSCRLLRYEFNLTSTQLDLTSTQLLSHRYATKVKTRSKRRSRSCLFVDS